MKNFIQNNYVALKSVIAFKRLQSKSRKIVFYAEDAQSQNFLFIFFDFHSRLYIKLAPREILECRSDK
jgi:hypothetical protein